MVYAAEVEGFPDWDEYRSTLTISLQDALC